MDHQLHSAHTHRTQPAASNVQNAKCNLMAHANLAEQILARRFGVLQHHRSCARASDAHLAFLGAASHAFLRVDDEGRELAAINLGEDDEDVCKAAVSNKHLLAIDKVMCAVFAKPRCCSRSKSI